LVAWLLFAFAGVVLVLTIAGVVGSVSYAVERRTRELGIRMAIGASGRDVWFLVQRGVLTSAAFGAIIGVALALEAGALVRGLLYGITPRDPAALVAGPAVTTLAILLSSAIPALRATRIDPAVAVRAE
jgi:ABC-type antimicrobial peptide transport system permease subunit